MTDLKASLLLYAVLCAQVTDWMTTVYALSLGGYEGNPIMRPLFDIGPLAALAPKLLIPFVVLVLYLGTKREDRPLMLWVILGYLVMSSIPVLWNLIQLMRAGLL